MLRMLGNPRRFCDGVTRREALTAGTLSVLGGLFNLPKLLALEAQRPAAPAHGKAKHVLLLYLHGGAPTQDMFDLKPAAPVEVRGEFKPIATNVAGIQICERSIIGRVAITLCRASPAANSRSMSTSRFRRIPSRRAWGRFAST